MRILITTFFAVLMISFGANAEIIYSYSYEYLPNKFMIVTVNTTAIKNTNTGELVPPYSCQSSYGMNYQILYSYNVEFFNASEQVLTNPPTINDLQGKFHCGSTNIFFDMNESAGNGQGASAGKYLGYPVCENATVENILCNEVTFTIKIQGATVKTKVVKVTGTSTLPIELITFDAYKKDREVELAWKTASELNNDYFTIERSVDGKSWENIQTVQGAGNSSQVIEYTWLDNSPYAGVSYYRLKQTDYDGTTETFNIVSVEQSDVVELQAYPNPVLHTSTLLGVDQNQAVRIFNTIGVEVTGNVGVSTSPSAKTFLNMSQLPKGMYYVTNGGKSIQLLKE